MIRWYKSGSKGSWPGVCYVDDANPNVFTHFPYGVKSLPSDINKSFIGSLSSKLEHGRWVETFDQDPDLQVDEGL